MQEGNDAPFIPVLSENEVMKTKCLFFFFALLGVGVHSFGQLEPVGSINWQDKVREHNERVGFGCFPRFDHPTIQLFSDSSFLWTDFVPSFGTGTFQVRGDSLIFLFGEPRENQIWEDPEKTGQLQVKDELSGDPIVGATILVVYRENGNVRTEFAVTDFDGVCELTQFQFKGQASVTLQYVGYQDFSFKLGQREKKRGIQVRWSILSGGFHNMGPGTQRKFIIRDVLDAIEKSGLYYTKQPFDNHCYRLEEIRD